MNQRQRMRARLGASAHQTNRVPGNVNSQRNVELHIDQLIVEGLQSTERYRFGDAVQAELSQLLAQDLALSNVTGPLELDRMGGESISIGSAPKAATIGRQVAEAVHRSFSQIGSNGGDSSGAATLNNQRGTAQ